MEVEAGRHLETSPKTKGRSLSERGSKSSRLYPGGKAPHTRNILIVAFLGASVNEYQANYLQFLGGLVFACPICHTVCHWHHWYRRKVADGTAVHSILILRVQCPSCRVTHAILPDFVRPRGRYVQQVRQTVVPCLVAGVPVEKAAVHGQAVETSRRWLLRLKETLEPATSALRSILAQLGRFPASAARGSPFCRLVRLHREIVAAIGDARHSCFFGAVNAILSLSGSGLWL